MCLNRLSNRKLPRSLVCWKVFDKEGPKKPMKGQCYGGPYKEGKHYKDRRKKPIYFYDNYPHRSLYASGFHAYKSLYKIRRTMGFTSVIRRVKLSRIVAVGYQGGKLVYVGRSMYIYARKGK